MSNDNKRNLLANFVKFVAWVIVIGLLLSLLACQPTDHKVFVSKEAIK